MCMHDIPTEDPTVPDLAIVFTNDSPRIAGNSVSGDFELTRPTKRVTCELLHTEHKVDCELARIALCFFVARW